MSIRTLVLVFRSLDGRFTYDKVLQKLQQQKENLFLLYFSVLLWCYLRRVRFYTFSPVIKNWKVIYTLCKTWPCLLNFYIICAFTVHLSCQRILWPFLLFEISNCLPTVLIYNFWGLERVKFLILIRECLGWGFSFLLLMVRNHVLVYLLSRILSVIIGRSLEIIRYLSKES